MTKRRRFSDKFKATVALEALRGDKTAQEIVAKHKIHPTQVPAEETADHMPKPRLVHRYYLHSCPAWVLVSGNDHGLQPFAA